MIFVALGLIGFGVGDFVRWSSGRVEALHAVLAAISGSLAGAGFVIAAKGFLRFREIRAGDRDDAEDLRQPGVDEITEYFLIGTFTSLLIAAGAGLLVLAAR